MGLGNLFMVLMGVFFLMKKVFFVFCFLLFFSFPVWAQTTNSSPTPIGGFTSFVGDCRSIDSPRQVVVCSSGECDGDNSSVLCSSSFSFLDNPSCSVSSSILDWGFSFPSSSCCSPDGVCYSRNTNPFSVGVFSSVVGNGGKIATQSVLQQTKIAIRDHEIFAVFDKLDTSYFVSSSDNGKTWSSPFDLKSLVSSSSLPSNVSLSSVSVLQPAVTVSSSGNVQIAFTIQDSSNQKSMIYRSSCGRGSSCSVSGNWNSANSIINPDLVVENGKWKFSLGYPKIVTVGDTVHVFFEDMDSTAFRLQGLLHLFCSSNCGLYSNWDSSANGIDILEGINNDFPHGISIARDADDDIRLVALDNENPLSPGRYSVWYAFYDSVSQSWEKKYVLPVPSSSYLPPLLAVSGDTVRIVLKDSSGFHSVECSGACSSSSDWEDASSDFSSLNSIGNAGNFIFFQHPFLEDNWVAIVQSDFMYGLYHGDLVVGPSRLSEKTSDLIGMMDYSSSVDFFGDESFWWASLDNGEIKLNYSDILDSDNSPPVVSLSIPFTPVVWSMDDTDSEYSETVGFSVQDSDFGETLYASVFLSENKNERGFILLENEKLNDWLGENGIGTCSGNDFVSASDCIVDVSLFDPLKGFSAPDGEYFLTVLVQDAKGLFQWGSTSNLITLRLSQLNISISNPKQGDAWSGNTQPNTLSLIIGNSFFVNRLGVWVNTENDTNSYSIGSFTVAEWNGINPYCMESNGYSCGFDIANPSNEIEGVFSLTVQSFEDDILSSAESVYPIILDYVSPRISSFEPSGIVSKPPLKLFFRVDDLSTPVVDSLSINGKSAAFGCAYDDLGADCTVNFPPSIRSGEVFVEILLHDSLENEGTISREFSIEKTANGSIPDDVSDDSILDDFPDLSNFIEILADGSIRIIGTPIVIPKTIVQIITSFSRRFISSSNVFLETTGNAGLAVVFALGVIAGLASDLVFRRLFEGIKSRTQLQAERLIRTFLGGLFALIPVAIGVWVSLSTGLIFAVMEGCLFFLGAYLVKTIQYYDTFGFKTLEKPKTPDGRDY